MAQSNQEDLTLPKPEFWETKIKIAQMIIYDPKTGKDDIVQSYILDADLISNDYIQILRDSKKRPCKYRPWSFRNEFLKYYEAYENRFSYYAENGVVSCPICSSENRVYVEEKSKIYYNHNYKVPYCWGSLTYHMIKEHYFEPPSSFIRNILSLSHYKFLKLDINDLNIFQGLVHTGSLKPRFKYIKKQKEDGETYGKKEKVFYEYGGYFVTKCEDENFCRLKDITIVNDERNTTDERHLDKVYTPVLKIDEFKEKKYTFHTHPVYYDIHYQICNRRLPLMYPSEPDIEMFTFYKMYYEDVEGHLIFAYEGTYYLTLKYKNRGIREFDPSNHPINLYVNKHLKSYPLIMQKKYNGHIKSKNDYFEMAYKDQYLIREMNKKLDEYNIRVVFFPRELTEKNKWEYGTIYLPYGVRKTNSEKDDNNDDHVDELDKVNGLDNIDSVNDDDDDYEDYGDSDSE